MKKVLATLFIAIVTITGIPTFGLANSNEANNTNNTEPDSYREYRVRANSTQTHRVFLEEGSAEIAISGDGDTDLDLYIYDKFGNRIASADGNTDDESVNLTIYRTGYFTVKIVNRGDVYNDYSMFVE